VLQTFPNNATDSSRVVLLVEDNPHSRFMAEEFLKHSGYKVISASRASEALRILLGDRPIDLIFSDIRLCEELNGIELAEIAKKLYPEIKILLTSSVSINDYLPDAQLGGLDFITKPFLLSNLAQRVNEIMKLN